MGKDLLVGSVVSFFWGIWENEKVGRVGGGTGYMYLQDCTSYFDLYRNHVLCETLIPPNHFDTLDRWTHALLSLISSSSISIFW
jgi:hypothetical protein